MLITNFLAKKNPIDAIFETVVVETYISGEKFTGIVNI